jgi:MFS family permease
VFQALRSVASLLLGAGILVLGNALLGITLPIRMNVEGMAAETAGLVMSAYYLGFVGGSLWGQTIIARVGHIRAFAAFAAVVGAATLMHPLWVAAIPWAVLRVVSGFCMAGLFATIESWLNVRSASASRGQILSLYMVTAYLGSGIGQLLVNAWGVSGVELFCLAALLMSLSLVPVVLTRVSGPDLSQVRRLGFRQLYALSPLGVIGACGAGVMSGAFYGMGAIFAQTVGLPVLGVSLFMGAAVLGGLVLQYPIGHISDRFDRRTVLAIILAAGAVVYLGAYLWSTLMAPALAPLLVIAALFGGTAATVYPVAVAHAFDYVERERMVAASGGLLLAWSVGATIGPLAASFAMGRFGAPSLFLVLAATAGSLALFTRYRMTRRPSRPSDEQSPFVSLPASPAVAGQLDPRAAPESEVLMSGPETSKPDA